MDELNPVEPEQTAPISAEPMPQASNIELESSLAQKNEELNQANARVSELEQALAELNQRLADTGQNLSQAIASYKALVIKSNPGILEELISGNSIGEVHASLEKAKTLIGRVRQGMEEEAARIRVPAGAPPRKPVDLSGLSTRDKILYAIGGKK